MVKAIDFVVRDSAGGVVRGSVAGEGSNFVQLGMGEEISLNLARESVAGFVQQGSDLVITLIDGRQVVLAGYFNEGGEPNQLYLSQNGEVVAVELSDAGDGTLFAAYGPTDGWDKFSTLDDLRFGNGDDLALAAGATDEPAGMAGFLPGLVGMGGVGAGLAGVGLVGGLVGGGGGGGGGSTGPRPPTVNNPGSSQTVMTESTDKTLDVSGTGEPGDRVVVTIGDKTKETTIASDGTWSVVFPETGLPADGTHETSVVFTHVGGGSTTLDGPTFIVDMTPPEVEVTDGAKSTGDVENAAEYTNGVTIAGEGEAGATIVVQVGTFTQTTTVGSNGTWSVTFPTSQIQTGEYEIPFTVTATDALGNDTVLNDILVVDTVPHPIGFNPVTADNMVNGAEATAGFQITGTSTAGASLTITVGTLTQTVTVGANGTWTTSFAPGTLMPGEYDATITANTVDAAGNASSSTHTFRVDTTTNVAFSAGAVEGDNTVNAFEAQDGVVLTGTAQPGATVQVAWNNTTLPATVAADGSWTVTFPASAVTAGTYSSTATVTATDAAGNTATATRTVNVDTETSVSFNNGQAGGDDIISGSERTAGVAITGRAEAGATVQVTLEGTTRTVTADANGNWTARFVPGEYREGTYSTMMSVMSTDRNGNVALSERPISIDTEVVPHQVETIETGADTVLNAAEAANGLTITGMAEAGSTVMVKLGNGTSVPATVAFDGSWTVTIPAGQIPAGENTVPMTITATDRVGNVSVINDDVMVDTLVRNFARTGGQIAGDGVVNAAEAAAGVSFSGTVEPGSTVVVRLQNGSEQTVTAGSNGTWSVSFSAAQLPAGSGTAQATFTATDLAGNTKSFTENFGYDTDAPDALTTLKIVRDGQEVTGIFTGTNGEDVTIHKIDSNGVTSEVTHDVNADVTVSVNGVRVPADNYDFDNGVPDGSYLVIGNTDTAGNEASTLLIVNNTNTVNVDLGRDGLSDFDFSKIDLTFAPQANLTLTAADLDALTGADKQLTISGGADDSVSLDNAVATGQSVNGFAVYTLGSGTVLVDEDINTTII
jgi:large repetitive protein